MRPKLARTPPSPAVQESLQVLEKSLPQSSETAADGALPYDETLKLNIRLHLIGLVEEFPSLQIKSESYTHNDGTTVTLLQAVGTIPITYHEVIYNIPVTVWLPELYPKSAPLVYVTPTRDMIIKRPHPHVDPSGFVSVPCLQSWQFPRSNLVELARSLSITFGQNPPLYANALPSTSGRPVSSSSRLSDRYPGMGTSAAAVASSSSLQSHGSLDRRPTSSAAWSSSILQSYNSLDRRPGSATGSGSASVMQSALDRRPSGSSYPAPHIGSRPSVDPRPTMDSSVRDRRPTSDSDSSYYRKQLVDTIADRISHDVDALKKEKDMDMGRLMSLQGLFRQRFEQCQQGFLQLQNEKEALEHQLQIVLTNTDILETRLSSNKNLNTEFDIDDVFEPVDAHSRQLLECSSEDLIIEDTLYCLDRAVQEGAIPIEVYLKHVRNLAREQFFYKAMAAKVRDAQAQTMINRMASRTGWYNEQ